MFSIKDGRNKRRDRRFHELALACMWLLINALWNMLQSYCKSVRTFQPLELPEILLQASIGRVPTPRARAKSVCDPFLTAHHCLRSPRTKGRTPYILLTAIFGFKIIQL
jgi:hypothetical protein